MNSSILINHILHHHSLHTRARKKGERFVLEKHAIFHDIPAMDDIDRIT